MMTHLNQSNPLFSRLVLAVGIGLLVSLCSSVGQAEEAPSSSEPAAASQADGDTNTPQELGRRHFEQGLRFVQREDWSAALAEFEESLRNNPTPVARFNRALCLKNLRRYRQSIAAFDEYIELHGGEIDAQRRAHVDRLVGEIRALLTAVTITVNVENAEILVDDDSVGTSPLEEPILLPSGDHEIEIRADGYRSEERDIVVVAGRAISEDFVLVERARVGQLRVESNVPEATVLIDGREVGTIPYAGELAEGEHEVEVRADGYRSGIQTVTIATGEDRIATVTLSERRGVHPAWFWTMVGLTGAGAIASGVMGGLTLSMSDEYEGDPLRTADAQTEGQRMAVGTDVVIGISAATAIAAIVLYFVTFPRRSERHSSSSAESAWSFHHLTVANTLLGDEL